jgi:hypothetical protein
MTKFMMIMMMNMMNNMMNQNNQQPKQDNSNSRILETLINTINGQRDIEKQILMDKMKELEMRTMGNDPLGEAKRVVDYMKTFRSMFGNNSSPEALEHERKLKEMEFKQRKQLHEEESRDRRMEQIGEMVNKSLGTFAEVLSKPAGEAVKRQIEKMGERGEVDLNDLGDIPDEMDLGELDFDQADIPEQPQPQEVPAYSGKKQRSPLFKVFEKGDDL